MMKNRNEDMMSHPAFFPYMIIRIMPAVYQQVLLAGAPLAELKRLVKEHPASRKLKTCLVLGPESCIYFTPEGEEKESTIIPKGGRLIEIPTDYESISGPVGGLIQVIEPEKPHRGGLVSLEGDEGVFSSRMIHIEPEASWLTVLKDGEGVNVLSYAAIIKIKSIRDKYKGGWEEFLRFCRVRGYPIITDNCLVATYDGDIANLYDLFDTLAENGLQNRTLPVDFYLADPTFSAMVSHYENEAGQKEFYRGSEAIGSRNDYEIEMFLEKNTSVRPGRIVARLREDNWYKHNKVFSKAINLYKQGDTIGSVFETGGVSLSYHAYEHLIKRSKLGRFRTDESDIVDCFLNFVRHYRYKSEGRLLLDWVKYHTEHRANVRYGRTYRDHFQTVGELQRSKNLTVDRLYEISDDRNSFGNACLALVYPVYHYAETLNLGMDDRHKLIMDFCRLTHSHPSARNAATLLFLLIEIALKGGNLFDIEEYRQYEMFSGKPPQGPDSLGKAALDFFTSHIDLYPEEFVRMYSDNVKALNTLFYALYCAKRSRNVQDVITNVVNFSGDVDSVLALAMMIWGIHLENRIMNGLNIEDGARQTGFSGTFGDL